MSQRVGSIHIFLSSACNATGCPNPVFYNVPRSVITFHSSSCNAWWHLMGSLLPVGVLFFSSYFSPSPRVSICLFFFFFNFNPYVLDCLISSLTLLQKFFMVSIQFLNYNLSYIVFYNSILVLLISHLTLGFFVRVLLVFNFVL